MDAVYNNLTILLKIVGTIFENTQDAAALLVLFIDRKSELEVNKVFVTLLKTRVCSVKNFTLVTYKVDVANFALDLHWFYRSFTLVLP
jgi:hypothetical protein